MQRVLKAAQRERTTEGSDDNPVRAKCIVPALIAVVVGGCGGSDAFNTIAVGDCILVGDNGKLETTGHPSPMG